MSELSFLNPTDLSIALIFERAADYIDAHGWWRRDMGDDVLAKPYPAACISNAIAMVTDRTNTRKVTAIEAQTELKNRFEVEYLSDVFDLNDAQPFNTGKQWATESLRQFARDIRAERR